MPTLRAATRFRPCSARTLRAVLATIAVPLLLVGVVAGFTSVSVTEVAGVLASGQMEWLLLSAVLYGAAHVISALVWREGLSAAGLRSLPLGQVMRAHWICRGASEFLPAQLGEIARVAALKNRPEISGRVLRVVGSIGAFKVVDGGLSLIVAVVIVGVLAAPLLPGLTTIAIVVATIIVALLGVVVLWRSRDSVFPLRIRAAFEELAVGVGLLRGDHPVAPAFALQSTAIVLRMLSLAALLPAYGAPVSAAPMMFALLILTGLLPISPGGAGVREAAVVPVLIVSYGVGLETALAISLATQAVGLAVSLLGAGIALAVGTRVGVTPAPAPTPQPV